jgi:hypothetical protein
VTEETDFAVGKNPFFFLLEKLGVLIDEKEF